MQVENLNQISFKIIGCAYKVHSALGPGLLESAYEVCLAKELEDSNITFEAQKPLPVIYKEKRLDAGYRIDLLVANQVIIELKAVDTLAHIHEAQLLTYMKLAHKKLGLLINFNVKDLKQGIKRMIL